MNGTFTLVPLPPFRLDLTAWVLRRRPDNAMDRWDGLTYRRVLALNGGAVDVAVCQHGAAGAARLEVVTWGDQPLAVTRPAVVAALERLLGLHRDLSDFYQVGAQDPILRPLIDRFRGFKPPRFPTVFECLANAITCQQITLTLGIRILNRLTEAYGLLSPAPDSNAHAFPLPEALAGLVPEDLRALQYSGQKARALIELAGDVAAGRLDLEALAELDDAAAIERLCRLRGVGRWSAEYALLRGLGRLHVFPGDDVGGRKSLQRWLGITEPLDYEGVRRVLAPWQRYGGLLYFAGLLHGIAGAGYLPEIGAPGSPRT